MQVPLEIAFHNLDTSEAAERLIRERVEKLDGRFGKLTACRVRVELPHRQHRKGNVYEVHIELSVPGRDLVVSREPHRAKDRYSEPDLQTSIRNAFDAAERQLQSFKEQIKGEVKYHEDTQFQGQVSQVFPEDDHGFLLTNTGSQLYFHRNAVLNGDFEKLKRGDTVHYVEAMGDTGPIASKVRLGPEHHLD